MSGIHFQASGIRFQMYGINFQISVTSMRGGSVFSVSKERTRAPFPPSGCAVARAAQVQQLNSDTIGVTYYQDAKGSI